MKLLSLLFAATLLFTFDVNAQAEISFEEREYNFGEIDEAGGSVSHRFVVRNTGKAPLIIQNVKPSCGCTTPGWTKEPIMPGKEGYIDAKYNPLNRPGAFNKSLTITSNASKPTEVIFIKGTVIPKPATIEDKLPTQLGNLRVRYNTLNMGNITTEKPVSKTYTIYNAGNADIGLKVVRKAPEYITVRFQPTVLKPGAEGEIVVTYDAAKSGEFGFNSDQIMISTTDAAMPDKTFTVMATITEYFPPLSQDELLRSPRLKMDEKNHDFSTVNGGETVSTTFTLVNNGKRDLIIRAIKPNCNCITTEMATKTIAPGAEASLKISFDTSNRRGNQIKKIDIFSNDPTNPVQSLTIKANVQVTGSR